MSILKVWTIANQKGGVGKTTSVATLGGLLAESGARVLMVDCDPHSSLTSYYGYDPDALAANLFDIFEADVKQASDLPEHVILPTQHEGLHLIGSSIALATLDRKFSQKPGMGLVLKHLRDALQDQFDYMLFDCPPVLGVLLVNALAAGEQLVVPVQTEFLALKGLERMMQTINMVTKAQRHSIEYLIVPTMFDRRTKASIATLRNMRDEFGMHLWEKVIPVDTKFRDASKQHQSANFLYPDARGVYAYRKLMSTLQAREHQEKVA
ncbi:ParA family protein [Pleionea litopenaei]|uniref:ParA family protein n=1 Tax=Pleionea litopenaei TaxID=3070815 RepID=A0AA51RUE0_9GAMM|nr:ParA family protein [Pleionea sp. HL-JVS1]WMS87695.1 ParA family protein [Pleionea sp. HL-JVS1]